MLILYISNSASSILKMSILTLSNAGNIFDVLNQWGGKDVICVAPLSLPVNKSMGQISQQDWNMLEVILMSILIWDQKM